MTLIGQMRHLSAKLTEAKLCIEDALVELKAAEEKAIGYDRLAGLGKMTGGVIHDLNNALTPVVAGAHLLQPEDVAAERKDSLFLMRDGIDHTTQLLTQLQHFYRLDVSLERVTEKVSLQEVMERAVQLTRFQWREEAAKQGALFDLKTEIPDGLTVMGNSTELLQVFTNLILNAVDAMPTGGTISIEATMTEDTVRVTVADQGAGMSPLERAQCLEPFFTTKETGSGMGLFVCKTVMERHGGSISAEPGPAKGSQFVLQFPRITHGQEISDSTDKVVKRVLVVDKEKRVRTSLTLLAKALGYTVDAFDPSELDFESGSADGYVVALVDLSVYLAIGGSIAGLTSPHVPIVVTSGWSTSEVNETLAGYTMKPELVLEKPISYDKLAAVLRRFDEMHEDKGERSM